VTPLLICAVFGALSYTVWLARRAQMRPSKTNQLREAALAIIAIERNLRFVEGADPHARGEVDGIAFTLRVVRDWGTDYCVSVVSNVSAAIPALAVWPREPPDSVASLGREVPTDDPVFDARFATVTAGSPDEIPGQLDADARAHLLALGTPAFVRKEGVLSLLLPAMPNQDDFEHAVAIIGRLGRPSGPPYRGLG
jgi:hypothetical protein